MSAEILHDEDSTVYWSFFLYHILFLAVGGVRSFPLKQKFHTGLQIHASKLPKELLPKLWSFGNIVSVIQIEQKLVLLVCNSRRATITASIVHHWQLLQG